MYDFRKAARLFIAVGMLAAVSLSGAGVSSAEPAQDLTAEQKAAALISPAVVYLQIKAIGIVFDRDGRALNNGVPFVRTNRCTGFVVRSDGYIATAGHCLDPAESKNEIVRAAAEGAAKPGENVEDLIAFGSANWNVEGTEPGSVPDTEVQVFGAGTRDAKAPPVPARVVDVRAERDGDVALLKVQPPAQVELPSSELAAEGGPAIGQPILAVGFPASTEQVVDPTLVPAVKSGSISAIESRGTLPVYQISAAITKGMSGGPTVDLEGRVVGLCSFLVKGETQAFNYIAPAQTLREMLARNGVDGGLSPADTAYRDGMNAMSKGQYTTAIDKLGQAEAMSGNHFPDASQQKLRAIQLRAQGAEASGGGPKTWMFLVGGLVLAAIVGGGLLMYFLSRRNPEPALAGGSVTGSPSPRPANSAVRPPASASSPSPGGGPSTAGGGGNCHNCGFGLAPGAGFCPRCGKSQG